jgi:hypothetical protein
MSESKYSTKIEWPDDLTPDSRCPFGKHQGKLMSEVPISWFKWVIQENDKDDSLRHMNWTLVVRYIKKHVTL